MYPNLTPWLLGLLVVAVLVLTVIGIRAPVSRRLAVRQITRRRTEATLVVLGSVLGTAIIVGSLVVGDTLNHSVRQTAYTTLGPIDEQIVSPSAVQGAAVAQSLASLRADPDVDGVLSAHAEQAALAKGEGPGRLAEPRTLVWDTDFAAAARFGAAGGPSGLTGPGPAPGEVVLNRPLADAVDARVGERVNLYVYGQSLPLTVSRIVPEQGLAGAGFGSTSNRDAFVTPGTLGTLAATAGTEPRSVTFVSNRGGVESGADHTDAVVARINHLIQGAAASSSVDTPKRDVLRAAQQTGDSLGSVF
ncbi:MAG TPA: ABC transporter permease, partial [Micromonosporaceae bacterium]